MSQTQKPKYIIAHFDAHGVATASARARSLSIPADKVYAKYPTTGPEQLPNYIDTFFPTLVNHDVEIIDIPVNVRNPKQYIDTINRLAQNTSVTIFDHHKTDYQFVTQMNAKVVIFGSGVEMAEALSNEQNISLAYIGVVADRDSSILSRFIRDVVNAELLPLANKLDMLVRQDADVALKNLITASNPVEYLRSVNVQYPPEALAKQVSIVRRGLNTVLIDMTTVPAQQISAWSWKTMEQVAITNRADYVVAVAEAFDRQVNTYVPVVQVIKYWLSDRPSPRPQLQPILGRTTVGHDDAFSVRALDKNDALQLAQKMFEELEVLTPRVTHLISDQFLASSIKSDYNAILQKLSQILELQTKMYSEYLELKKKQVELLERTAERGRTYD
jgi:hypothetical protein